MDGYTENSSMESARKKLWQKYEKAALNPRGLFPYPVGREGLEALGYDMKIVNKLDPHILEFFCGVGNPFSLGKIVPGERILDMGCGAGVDTLIAALITGPDGKAAGIEMVDSMYERACSNLNLSGLMNVRFFHGTATDLPFENDSFDIIISNGVFHLIPDREQTLKEALRVLRPGGRIMLADQVMKNTKDSARYPGEVLPGMEFLGALKRAGFRNVEVIEQRKSNNLSKTAIMLFKGEKPC